jgi:hypothetical protein
VVRAVIPHVAPPEGFVSDKCSSLGKLLERTLRWLGYEIEPWCVEHDVAGCTRCHAEGALELAGAKVAAAWVLRERIRTTLPWWLHWTAGQVFVAVATAGGYWNTCGPEAGDLCRHGMRQPAWMRRVEAGRISLEVLGMVALAVVWILGAAGLAAWCAHVFSAVQP